MEKIRNSVKRDVKGRHDISSSNIPPIEVKNIVDFIEAATGSKVVIIGGRAVNIWTQKHVRDSHDIDIVIGHKPTPKELDEMIELAAVFGAEFRINGDPNSASRVQLLYYCTQSEDGKKEAPVKIDLYYPGYVSSVNGRMPKNDIGGVQILDILRDGEERRFFYGENKSVVFTVASIAHMLQMKNSAVINSGENESDKHKEDVKALTGLLR